MMKPRRLMGESLPASLEQLEAWEEAGAGSGFLFLYGHRAVLRLSLWLLAGSLLRGERILILEGSNSFDPYFIARMSRALARNSRAFLRQIRISRAFTCHQMRALTGKAHEAAARYGSRVIVASGLSTTFYDEDVPDREANRLFQETPEDLRGLAGEGRRLVVTGEETRGSRRRDYVAPLRVRATRVIRLGEQEPGTMFVRSEKPVQPQLSTTLPRALLSGWDHWRPAMNAWSREGS
jgi:hypothetical protein